MSPGIFFDQTCYIGELKFLLDGLENSYYPLYHFQWFEDDGTAERCRPSTSKGVFHDDLQDEDYVDTTTR